MVLHVLGHRSLSFRRFNFGLGHKLSQHLNLAGSAGADHLNLCLPDHNIDTGVALLAQGHKLIIGREEPIVSPAAVYEY